MKRFCIIGIGIITAVCLLASDGHADTVKKKRPYDKITAVDATAKTVTIASGPKAETQDYKVDAFTTIIVNGKSGKLSDVQVDMKVDFSVRSDGKTLTKLEVDDPPVDKSAKK